MCYLLLTDKYFGFLMIFCGNENLQKNEFLKVTAGSLSHRCGLVVTIGRLQRFDPGSNPGIGYFFYYKSSFNTTQKQIS